jgi:hypothetical protein
MSDLVKKVGSLLLASGALSLILLNAGMSQGCGGARRDGAVIQASPPPPETAKELGAAEAPDSDCEEPAPYMYATKAPVMPVRHCRKTETNAAQVAEPAVPAGNAQQQAP